MTSRKPLGAPAPPNLADFNEKQLRAILRSHRWPNGFVCPKCHWAHTLSWAKQKSTRMTRKGGPAASCSPPDSFHAEWSTRQDRIICQQCGHQASMTAGTLLQGSRLPLAKIRDAVIAFIKASNGISAEELGAGLSINTLSARSLMQKFRHAMKPWRSELPSGVVAVDESILHLPRCAKGKDDKAYVVIGVEKRGTSHGRIGLQVAEAPFDYVFALCVTEMVRKKSTIETRNGTTYDQWLKNDEYFVKQSKSNRYAFGTELLAPCKQVFDHVSNILMKTFRGAIKPEHLQSYLDEIAFRWNHRDNPNEAAWKLLTRLISPPGSWEIPEEPSNDALV